MKQYWIGPDVITGSVGGVADEKTVLRWGQCVLVFNIMTAALIGCLLILICEMLWNKKYGKKKRIRMLVNKTICILDITSNDA